MKEWRHHNEERMNKDRSVLNENKFGVKHEQISDDLSSFWVDEEIAP